MLSKAEACRVVRKQWQKERLAATVYIRKFVCGKPIAILSSLELIHGQEIRATIRQKGSCIKTPISWSGTVLLMARSLDA